MTQLKRRQVLAGVGALGALGAAGAGLGWTGRHHGYTNYTYAQTIGDTDDSVVQVAWYETYNGQLQETQNGTDSGVNATLDPNSEPLYVEDATGPVISLDGVMPGDRGQLMIGLAATADPTNVWLRPTVSATAENGRNEPERKAGDTTDGVGELQNAVQVRLWKDTGVLDSGIGGCDGRLLGDPELTSGATALSVVGEQFSDGTLLADCLQPDSTTCVGLTWELPAETGNEIQTDSVEFGLEFVAIPCSEDCNPFLDECQAVVQ